MCECVCVYEREGRGLLGGDVPGTWGVECVVLSKDESIFA